MLVGIEISVDGIERDESGERRLRRAGLDQVPFRDFRAADASGDGRGDAGEFEIELRATKRAFDGGDAGHGGYAGGRATIVFFLGHAIVVVETFGTLEIILRASGFGFGLIEIAFQAIDFGLERARIDFEEEVALLNDGAFFEQDALKITGNAGTNFNGIDGLEMAGKFIDIANLFAGDGGYADGDGVRRGGSGGFGLFGGRTAGYDGDEGEERGGEKKMASMAV